jgi:hypothetical protein
VFLRAGGRFKRTVDEHPEEPAVGRGDHTDEVEWAVADGDFEVVDAGVLDDQKDDPSESARYRGGSGRSRLKPVRSSPISA